MQTQSYVTDLRNRIFQLAIQLTALLSFLALAFIVYGHVFSNGLCCADDSTNAIVAKNLAFGKGYANSVRFDGTPGLMYFDPTITTGPTLNIPAALMIHLFGNVPWAPGFVTATSSLVLILLIVFALYRLVSPNRAAAFLSLWLFLLYSMTAGLHFEHWYSLIGEIPAALFCVLGALVLATDRNKRSVIAVSSLLYGLAMLTKLLALLAFFPIAAWLLCRLTYATNNRIRRAGDCLWAATAYLGPFVSFEAWKLITLGPASYIQNTREFMSLFLSNSGTVGSAMQQYHSNSLIMQRHFGYSPIVLLLVAVVVSALVVCYCKEHRLRFLLAALIGAAIVNSLWWLFSSNGWPRYALIGLFLYFSALPCLLFVKQSKLIVGSLAALILCLFWVGYARFAEPGAFVRKYRYAYTPRVTNLIKATAELQELRQNEPFVMGWWATAGDLEYSLPTIGNFVRYDHVDRSRDTGDLILVRNKVWVAWGTTPDFTEWEKKCNEVLLDAPPYLISRCSVNPKMTDIGVDPQLGSSPVSFGALRSRGIEAGGVLSEME